MKNEDLSDEIANLACIFSEPIRVRIIMLLMEHPEGLTTSEISTRVARPQPRVSTHLAALLKQQAVSVSDRGRQRVYRIGSDKVASLLEDLVSFFPTQKRTQLLKASKNFPSADSEIRQCRTCYDHLAGVVGVKLLRDMLEEGWLAKETEKYGTKPFYRLTRTGSKSLVDRGVDVEKAARSSRIFAYGCLDWTENLPHLGGSIGNAILNAVLSAGVVERKKGTRALKVLKPAESWIKAARKKDDTDRS